VEKVIGIGGIFFRAKDPRALAAWYDTHLGISPTPTDLQTPPWVTEEGITVLSPFAHDSEYFPSDREFMLNFRVHDLAAMLAQLRTAGIEVTREEQMEGLGCFARIHDPEGNPVELWEPSTSAS